MSAQDLLTDDFSSPNVDLVKWEIAIPFGGSSVNQNGGFVTVSERGTLISEASFYGDIQISGSFTLNQDLEHFKIVARTDGLIPTGNSFAERNGVIFAFSNDGDQISIQRIDSDNNHINLAVKSYALQTGQTYRFSASLIGSSLQLAVDGVEELTATSDYSSGARIALFSRVGFGTSSTLDTIAITAFPKPLNLSIVTALSLKFDTILGRSYTIQKSLDLEIWIDVETDISGDGTRMQRFYEMTEPKQFYRIKP